MSIYKVGETYYASISIAGKSRIRRTLGTTDKREAQRLHDELKARLWAEPVSKGYTLGHAFVLWLAERERGRSDKSNVAILTRELGDGLLLSAVNQALFVREFGNRAPGTFNRLLATLHSVLTTAKHAGYIDAVPDFKKRKEPASIDRHLTAEEWQALRSHLPEHQQRMADFAIATGLRWSNVANLRWRQVNLQTKTIAVQASSMKARASLAVPLSRSAVDIIKGQIGQSELWVFPYNGRAMTSPKTAFTTAREKAGLPHVRWHDLRHTWASWHAMGGTPEQVLQKLGGWRSEAHRRYSHLAPQYLAGFADNAKPVGKVSKKRVTSKRKAA